MKLPFWILGLPMLLAAGSASAETLSVKVASANFRARPHETAELKFSADKFFPVDVLEKKNGWVKVKDFEGDEAWVLEKMLGATPSVVVSTANANIREGGSTASDVLFTVKHGEVFKIEERKGEWLKVVDANGDGGWIRHDMVWGEPLIEAEKAAEKATEKVVEKATEAGKGATAAKETTAVAEKAVEVVQKVEHATTDVKAPSATELEALSKKAAEWASRPENLEVLCRAYLEDMKQKPVEKPKATTTKKPKTADKKSDKPKAATNQKASKPTQKKNQKKSG